MRVLCRSERVWGITKGTESDKVDLAIESTEKFFNSLGVSTRLSDYGIGDDTIKRIVDRFVKREWSVGENYSVTPDKIEKVLICQK